MQNQIVDKYITNKFVRKKQVNNKYKLSNAQIILQEYFI